jgi:uncharacterized protein YjiS (DUF1127 family)
MSTIYGATGLGQTAALAYRVSSFFKRCWDDFQERRERHRLRATLSNLSDRELMDIGTTRGEIDYVASNRSIDLRGIRSAEWVRYLPAVDGQIVARRRTNTRKPTSGRGQTQPVPPILPTPRLPYAPVATEVAQYVAKGHERTHAR